MHKLLFFISIFIFNDIKADTIYDPLGKYLGKIEDNGSTYNSCLLYTSPSPRDGLLSRMPSSA